MALNLKEIQNIDHRTRMLIHGFNNEARKLFPQDIPYYNIPSIVNHICLLFYWQNEYFGIFDDKYVNLSDDGMKVTALSGGHWITIYGNMIFDNKSFPNTIIEYEMATSANSNYLGAIGIVSAGKEQEKTDALIWDATESKHNKAYTLHLSPYGNMYQIGNATMKKNFDGAYTEYEDGDKISMIVNISDKSVTFSSIATGAQIGSYLDIDFSIKYRMAISIDPKNSVELLDVKFSQK